jgi:hypothetical protein
LKAHAFVDSDDSQDFEHFVRPESCQGEVFGKPYSDIDVRLSEGRNNMRCMHMQRQARNTPSCMTMDGFDKKGRRGVDRARL